MHEILTSGACWADKKFRITLEINKIKIQEDEKIACFDHIAFNRDTGLFPAFERKADAGNHEFQISIVDL
jgi:hypothetical protein